MPHSSTAVAYIRKRQLTEAEKAEIWQYHQEHPLVTHGDVASFFGVERRYRSRSFDVEARSRGTNPLSSTVSKIVHSPQYGTNLDIPLERSSNRPSRTISRLYAETTLQHWVTENQQNGRIITRAMLRKKAAIVAATAWMQRRAGMNGNATDKASGESSVMHNGSRLPSGRTVFLSSLLGLGFPLSHFDN